MCLTCPSNKVQILTNTTGRLSMLPASVMVEQPTTHNRFPYADLSMCSIPSEGKLNINARDNIEVFRISKFSYYRWICDMICLLRTTSFKKDLKSYLKNTALVPFLS